MYEEDRDADVCGHQWQPATDLRHAFRSRRHCANRLGSIPVRVGGRNVEIPPGNSCAGPQLGLNATVQLAGVERADENGTARLDVNNVPNAACGRVYIQAIDLETCATTNVVLVE